MNKLFTICSLFAVSHTASAEKVELSTPNNTLVLDRCNQC